MNVKSNLVQMKMSKSKLLPLVKFCRKMQILFPLHLTEEIFSYFGYLNHNLNMFYIKIEYALIFFNFLFYFLPSKK